MASKTKCPFRKATIYDNQNWNTGVAIISTREEFEDCLGEECVAYESYPVSKIGYCKLCSSNVNKKEN